MYWSLESVIERCRRIKIHMGLTQAAMIVSFTLYFRKEVCMARQALFALRAFTSFLATRPR